MDDGGGTGDGDGSLGLTAWGRAVAVAAAAASAGRRSIPTSSFNAAAAATAAAPAFGKLAAAPIAREAAAAAASLNGRSGASAPTLWSAHASATARRRGPMQPQGSDAAAAAAALLEATALGSPQRDGSATGPAGLPVVWASLVGPLFHFCRTHLACAQLRTAPTLYGAVVGECVGSLAHLSCPHLSRQVTARCISLHPASITLADVWLATLTPWRARPRLKGTLPEPPLPQSSGRYFNYAAAAAAAVHAEAAADGRTWREVTMSPSSLSAAVRAAPDFAAAVAANSDFAPVEAVASVAATGTGSETDAAAAANCTLPLPATAWADWVPWVRLHLPLYTVGLASLLQALTGGRGGAGVDFTALEALPLLDALERTLDVWTTPLASAVADAVAAAGTVWVSDADVGGGDHPQSRTTSPAVHTPAAAVHALQLLSGAGAMRMPAAVGGAATVSAWETARVEGAKLLRRLELAADAMLQREIAASLGRGGREADVAGAAEAAGIQDAAVAAALPPSLLHVLRPHSVPADGEKSDVDEAEWRAADARAPTSTPSPAYAFLSSGRLQLTADRLACALQLLMRPPSVVTLAARLAAAGHTATSGGAFNRGAGLMDQLLGVCWGTRRGGGRRSQRPGLQGLAYAISDAIRGACAAVVIGAVESVTGLRVAARGAHLQSVLLSDDPVGVDARVADAAATASTTDPRAAQVEARLRTPSDPNGMLSPQARLALLRGTRRLGPPRVGGPQAQLQRFNRRDRQLDAAPWESELLLRGTEVAYRAMRVAAYRLLRRITKGEGAMLAPAAFNPLRPLADVRLLAAIMAAAAVRGGFMRGVEGAAAAVLAVLCAVAVAATASAFMRRGDVSA